MPGTGAGIRAAAVTLLASRAADGRGVLSHVPHGPRHTVSSAYLRTETRAPRPAERAVRADLASQAPATGGLFRAPCAGSLPPTPHPPPPGLWLRLALPGCEEQGDARRADTPRDRLSLRVVKSAEGSEERARGGPGSGPPLLAGLPGPVAPGSPGPAPALSLSWVPRPPGLSPALKCGPSEQGADGAGQSATAWRRLLRSSPPLGPPGQPSGRELPFPTRERRRCHHMLGVCRCCL